MSVRLADIEKTKQRLELDIGCNEVSNGLPLLEFLLNAIHVSGTKTENEKLMYEYLCMISGFVDDFTPVEPDADYVVEQMMTHLTCGEDQIKEAMSEARSDIEESAKENDGILHKAFVEKVLNILDESLSCMMCEGANVMRVSLREYMMV